MSKIRKKPIIKDPSVTVTVKDRIVTVQGAKGQLSIQLPPEVTIVEDGNQFEVETKDEKQNHLVGLTRSLIQNAILGVTKGWSKTLELVGVGYRAQTTGNALQLHLGFSHAIDIQAPEGISFQVVENKITVLGKDKYLVGELAAKIRRLKPPEPYKGKGIHYVGEYIRKKAGKAAKAVGGAAGGAK